MRYNDIRSSDGLSPNGKATDSDSVIFKVRILVAQLKIQEMFPGFFVFYGNRADAVKLVDKLVRKRYAIKTVNDRRCFYGKGFIWKKDLLLLIVIQERMMRLQ